MNLLIILDKERQLKSTHAMQIYNRYLRWQARPIVTFVTGVHRETTLSYTLEYPDLFYNTRHYLPIDLSPLTLEASITQYTYLQSGEIWERYPSQGIRFICQA